MIRTVERTRDLLPAPLVYKHPFYGRYDSQDMRQETVLRGQLLAAFDLVPKDVADDHLDRYANALRQDREEGGHVFLDGFESFVKRHLMAQSLATGRPHSVGALAMAANVQARMKDMMPKDDEVQGMAKEAFPFLCIHGTIEDVWRFKDAFDLKDDALKEGGLQIVKGGSIASLVDFMGAFPDVIDKHDTRTHDALVAAIARGGKSEHVSRLIGMFPHAPRDAVDDALQGRYLRIIADAAEDVLETTVATGVPITITPQLIKNARAGYKVAKEGRIKFPNFTWHERNKIAIETLFAGQDWVETTPPVLTTDKYMNTVYEAEGRKKVLYFSGTSGMRDYSLEETRYGGRDGFSHLPYHDPWDERNTFQYASTLSTAPRDLLKPVDGYSPNSEGYTYVAKDVPGGVIMADNTRRQSKMLEKTLEHYGNYDGLNCLELGAGACVSAGETSRQPNCIVDTVALSPTSPRVRLNKTWEELVCDVAKTLHEGDAPWEQWQAQLRRKGVDEHTQAGVRRIYYCTKKGPSRLLDPPYPISTRVAFGLHMLFPKLEIFTETAGDYLGTQYIGGFLDDVKLPKGRYQIINDDNGPVWHLTTNRSVFFDNSRSLSSVISGVYENLADDGVLICSRVPGGGISQLRQDVEMFHLPSWDPRRSMWRMGQDGEKPTIVPDKADIIVVGEGAEPQFILAKDKSPIASHLRKRLNLDDGQGGIFEVKDPLALLNAS